MPYEKVGKNEPVCIADEVPFEIPDTWEWVRISDVFQIEMGQSPKGDSVSEFQDGMEFHQGKVFFGDKYISMSNQKTTAPTKIAEPNSILLCVRAPVGKVNITDRILCIGRGLCALKPLGNIDVDYAFHLLETYESIFVKQATGTTFIAITGEVVRNQLIPLPPIQEQLRILKKIKELLPLIKDYDVVEKSNASLIKVFPELLKKSILQEAVQGKLVPQDKNDEPASVLLECIRAEKQALIKAGKIKKDKNESVIFRRDNSHYEKRSAEVVCIDDEIPFEIPDSWEWVRFDSATIYTTDYVANGSFASLRENVKSYKTPNYAIMVKTQDFANNFTRDLTYTDEAGFNFLKKSELFGGELMLSNIGASIGKVFIIPKMDKPMTLAPNSIVVKCIDNVTTRYLQYLMLSFYGQEMLKGFTAGTAMPKFSKTQLRNSLIPLPPHKLQERIVAKLDELFLKVDAL